MKKWLVFLGDDYYPSGGARDFVDSFDDQDEAIKFAKTQKQTRYDWAHIADRDTMQIIFSI